MSVKSSPCSWNKDKKAVGAMKPEEKKELGRRGRKRVLYPDTTSQPPLCATLSGLKYPSSTSASLASAASSSSSNLWNISCFVSCNTSVTFVFSVSPHEGASTATSSSRVLFIALLFCVTKEKQQQQKRKKKESLTQHLFLRGVIEGASLF